MAALEQSEFQAEITWLGLVPAQPEKGRINSYTQERLDFDFGGAIGELHHGELRPSCVRVTMLYPKGTEIRNTRQLSILSQEELDDIASQMGLPSIDPAWLGATIVLRGIPDFTHIPPSSRLQSPSGLTLTIDMENLPCILPGKEIEREHAGLGKSFKPAAEERRGVTAWVERPGQLAVGDHMKLFLPSQRGWLPQN